MQSRGDLELDGTYARKIFTNAVGVRCSGKGVSFLAEKTRRTLTEYVMSIATFVHWQRIKWVVGVARWAAVYFKLMVQ